MRASNWYAQFSKHISSICPSGPPHSANKDVVIFNNLYMLFSSYLRELPRLEQRWTKKLQKLHRGWAPVNFVALKITSQREVKKSDHFLFKLIRMLSWDRLSNQNPGLTVKKTTLRQRRTWVGFLEDDLVFWLASRSPWGRKWHWVGFLEAIFEFWLNSRSHEIVPINQKRACYFVLFSPS